MKRGRRLAKLYGSNVDKVFEYAHILSAVSSPLPLGLLAQVYYAVHREMAYSPVDFLVRRTGMLYFHIDHFKLYKDDVLQVMKQLLNYSEEETASFRKQLDEIQEDATLSGSREE